MEFDIFNCYILRNVINIMWYNCIIWFIYIRWRIKGLNVVDNEVYVVLICVNIGSCYN